jgi:GcrA cell cycle regulator
MEWTDETIATLRALWDEGLPTAEIGRRLGMSKNAVVGKAHRLDLPARPSPIRRDGPSSGRSRRTAVRAVGTTLPRLVSLTPVDALERLAAMVRVEAQSPPPRPQLVAVSVAPDTDAPKPRVFCADCQWVVSLKPTRMCEAKAERGAYCAEHARAVYVKPRGTISIPEAA